jgi:GH35 family endo-1,4-beta-xylanase
MNKLVQFVAAALGVTITVVGTTVAVDSRYAKSQEVKQQLNDFYEKQLKLRILEIDLKPNPSPSDQALKQYLLQELKAGN